MGCDASRNSLFQLIANSRCNSSALIVSMNIQTVKIPGTVYISKAYNDIIFNSDYTVVPLK